MSPHSGSDVRPDDDSERSDLASEYMSNTSTLPIFREGHDCASLMTLSPAFAREVWPHAMETVLAPGDLLVMPPGWWHAMTGEGQGPGWSVSMWY